MGQPTDWRHGVPSTKRIAMNSIPHWLRRILAYVSHRTSGTRRHREAGVAAGGPNVRAPSEGHRVHADERTIRRIAEGNLGGTSSAESRQAYLRGDNPGGLHQGGHGPAPRQRGSDDEPVDPSAIH
jgi:hypothetical protein